jgi:GcrA cell cycle regulator
MNDNRTLVALRLKVLPRRHRIAHLRALIELEPKGSSRGEQLFGLLHAEASGGSAD